MPDAENVDQHKVETAEPIVADDGVAMHGKYPLNHRLRAEALAKAGRKSDPDDLITDSLIALTATRLDEEKAAAAKAKADDKSEPAKAAEIPTPAAPSAAK